MGVYFRKHETKDGRVTKTAWGRKVVNGKEYRESLKTNDRQLANRRFKAWEAELNQHRLDAKKPRTFDDAALKFIEEHLPTLKPKSAQRYMVSLANLTPAFENKMMARIGTADLTDFVNERRKKVSAPTVRRDLACLSSLFGMAIEWEWIDVNPVGGFLRRMRRRGLREAAPRTRYLTKDEEASLLEKAAPYVAEAIKFAIETGLRKEEQFSRTWDDLDLGGDPHVTIKGTDSKNARDRRVPLTARALAVLKALPRHDTEPHVFWHMDLKHTRAARRFNTVDRGLKAAARRAGIRNLRWHDLRRTCGCRLLQDRRASIEEVSKWLGHSSITVTQRAYAFLESEQLRRIVASESE